MPSSFSAVPTGEPPGGCCDTNSDRSLTQRRVRPAAPAVMSPSPRSRGSRRHEAAAATACRCHLIHEAPYRRFGRSILLIRCGDDARVHLDGALGAHAAYLAFLQRTQQLRLNGGRDFTDFVAEERAVPGDLEEAGFVSDGR
jgi:hypothetical protein